ncbi:MAG: hypothetical protein GY859_03445 [Desulfobacterales bacterium]|nr:hypothetical protein [Desulfobacterales bacterium]
MVKKPSYEELQERIEELEARSLENGRLLERQIQMVERLTAELRKANKQIEDERSKSARLEKILRSVNEDISRESTKLTEAHARLLPADEAENFNTPMFSFDQFSDASNGEIKGSLDVLWRAVQKCEDAVNTEITRKEQLEKERRKREKLQGVLEMAGAVCHELNQPLMTISGYCELILSNMEDDDPNHGLISTIKNQSDRMGKLTYKIGRITRYRTKDYIQNGKIIDIEEASSQSR